MSVFIYSFVPLPISSIKKQLLLTQGILHHFHLIVCNSKPLTYIELNQPFKPTNLLFSIENLPFLLHI